MTPRRLDSLRAAQTPWQQGWGAPNTTQCEPDTATKQEDQPYVRGTRAQPSSHNPYKEQIEQLQKELDEPCQACMYTGVATCLGLSVYFVKLATDETTLAKNRRFLWGCSAASIVAGAVRFYLG